MAQRNDTIIILGIVAGAFLIFRKEVGEIFGGAGQAFQGAGQAVDTSLNSVAALLAGASLGGQSIIREFSQNTNEVLRDVTNVVGSAADQTRGIITETGGLVQTGLRSVPDAVSFPFRLGRGVGDFTQDIFLGGNRTVGGGAINARFAPLQNWITSATQNVRQWVSNVVSSPGPVRSTTPTPSSSNTTTVQTALRSGGSSSSSSRRRSNTPAQPTAAERLAGMSFFNPFRR